MYLISKKGFSLLAMGFTGKKAAEWKEKYIAAFNNNDRGDRATSQNPPSSKQTTSQNILAASAY